jgi:hypothetical protein
LPEVLCRLCYIHLSAPTLQSWRSWWGSNGIYWTP